MLDRMGKLRLGRTLTALGMAATLGWAVTVFVGSSAWYDGWTVYAGHGQLEVARYWSPAQLAAAREVRASRLDRPGSQFWYPIEFGTPAPPPPRIARPPNSSLQGAPAGGAPGGVQAAGVTSITLAPATPWSIGLVRRESINGFGVVSEGVLVILWPWGPVLAGVGGWLWARHRRGSGNCPGCGYPREGVPAGQPCPECGRAAAPG